MVSARKARDLAQKTFDITAKEQELGAGSKYQTLTARRDLAAAESALVAAMTAYQKAKIELDRSVGSTLEANWHFDRISKDGHSSEWSVGAQEQVDDVGGADQQGRVAVKSRQSRRAGY